MPDSVLGSTGVDWLLRLSLGVAVLLIVIGLLTWLSRRSRGGAGSAHKIAPAKRLAVLDEIAIDERRRLVLIQRDDVQHLVILGGANELVVETGIGRARPEDSLIPPVTRGDSLVPRAETLRAPDALRAPELPRVAEFPRAPELAPALRIDAPVVAEPPRIAPTPAPKPAQRPVQSAPAAPERSREPVIVEPRPPVEEPRIAVAPAPLARAPETPTPPEPTAPAPEPAKSGLLSRIGLAREAAVVAPVAAGAALAAASAPARQEAQPVEPPAPAPEAVAPRLDVADLLPEIPPHSAPEIAVEPLATEFDAPSEPVTGRAEPDMSKLFDLILPPEQDTVPAAADAETPLVASPTSPAPATPSPAAPAPEPATAASEARVAVKIDPYFASMAQRLEETLRRPVTGPQAASPQEIEKAIDLALSAPEEPARREAPHLDTPPSNISPEVVLPPEGEPATTAAPPVAPPQPDDLEFEMANLLGRAPAR